MRGLWSPVVVGGPTLSTVDEADIRRALLGEGLWFDIGAATIRVQSDVPAFPAQLHRVYGAFPFRPSGAWADLHCRLARPTSLRRWVRPKVVFRCEGQHPFDPFPADSPLPLFEWGCNWLIGGRLNNLLLLHAGALERDGLALVLPALPGSGKSTLTAALSQRGWRLLSDEFGAYDPARCGFRSMLKPVALKNQSIDVITRFAPQAVLGPSFPRTHKGTVAHLAAGPDAIAQRGGLVPAGAVLLPKWLAGAPLRLTPVPPQNLFSALAFNAFNYRTLGGAGFDAVLDMAQRCPGWHLSYSNLDEAVAGIDSLWAEVRAHHRRGPLARQAA